MIDAAFWTTIGIWLAVGILSLINQMHEYGQIKESDKQIEKENKLTEQEEETLSRENELISKWKEEK